MRPYVSRNYRVGKHATTISTDDKGWTHVTYHRTRVVSFNCDSVILRSGGWLTNTTKLRMNQASNQFFLGYQVYQKDWTWYVVLPNGETREFTDRMMFERAR